MNISVIGLGISTLCLYIIAFFQYSQMTDLHKWAEDVSNILNDKEAERISNKIFKPKVVQLKERTDAEKIEYFSNKFIEYYAKYHNATLEIKKLEKELRKKK